MHIALQGTAHAANARMPSKQSKHTWRAHTAQHMIKQSSPVVADANCRDIPQPLRHRAGLGGRVLARGLATLLRPVVVPDRGSSRAGRMPAPAVPATACALVVHLRAAAAAAIGPALLRLLGLGGFGGRHGPRGKLMGKAVPTERRARCDRPPWP